MVVSQGLSKVCLSNEILPFPSFVATTLPPIGPELFVGAVISAQLVAEGMLVLSLKGDDADC